MMLPLERLIKKAKLMHQIIKKMNKRNQIIKKVKPRNLLLKEVDQKHQDLFKMIRNLVDLTINQDQMVQLHLHNKNK